LQRLCILLLLAISFQNLYSNINDYVYRYNYPTFSNYGTLGLLNAPSARFYEEGTLGFSWSHNQPYLRGSIVAYPFSWFEASYQYTDINNYLYSPYKDFSGGQSFKDKSFDAKFKLFAERKFIPQVALGFRDIAGTGIFSGEYLVATKNISNLDITVGVGWGSLSGGKKYTNPLSKIDDRFNLREIETSEGGEFSIDAFFSGDIGIFGGIEYAFPFARGAKLKLEYDPVDYNIEGLKKVKTQSRLNFGFVYPFNNHFSVRFGMTKGNNLNFSFQYKLHNKSRESFKRKFDPPKDVQYSGIIKQLTSEDPTNARSYRAAKAYLSERNIQLQSANISENKFEMTFTQTKYWEHVRGIGRAYRVLDQVLPENISHISLSHLNANMDISTIEIPRDSFRRYRDQKLTTPLLNDARIYNGNKIMKNHEFIPPASFPYINNNFEPFIRSQVGGPDGFYFGEVGLTFGTEIIISDGLVFDAQIAQGLYNNFSDLKVASNSILPHVRSDIVKYLKATEDKAHINTFQLNYFLNPYKDLYLRFGAGIFEHMFGGYGLELLYRPFDAIWGIGFDISEVKQRDFDMLFDFQDYETITGHLNFYIREPRSNIMIYVAAGRYLAKDSGFTIDFSRRFKNGTNIGAFFSLTDISKEEFGEGSFDKGIYFNIPLQVFTNDFRRGQTSFSLKPLTRDGAQRLGHSKRLWGLTTGSRYQRILSDWEVFYD